ILQPRRMNILAKREIVKATSLAWTIVRPPKLTNDPPKAYVASLELQPGFFAASRADIAAFIADELKNNAYLRQAVFVASRSTHSFCCRGTAIGRTIETSPCRNLSDTVHTAKWPAPSKTPSPCAGHESSRNTLARPEPASAHPGPLKEVDRNREVDGA